MRARWPDLARTIGAGIVLGALAALSPLFPVVAALAAVVVVLARRGLPADERRWLTTILLAALAIRMLIVAALVVAGSRAHGYGTSLMLFGDEEYAFSRALRTRNVLLGLPVSKFDYVVMFDAYGRTLYTALFTWVQIFFGPSPYASRLLNAVLFVAASALMYRCARRTFGIVPALIALVALMLVPSLLFWSISLLKESLYFLLSAIALDATVAIVRRESWTRVAAAAVALAGALLMLGDLRPGAIVLTAGGFAIGVAAWWAASTRARATIAVAVVVAAAGAAVFVPRVSARVTDALNGTARQHAGHVFTVGHSYRTLDDRFYTGLTPAATLQLTRPEAARYVARSIAAFVIIPLPWQVATRSELVFVPEQIAWYLMIAFAVIGIAPAWRRDPLLTALLAGYIIAMSTALALVNGNVGTLVRLRALVIPFLLWLSAFGAAAAFDRLTPAEARPA